MFKKLAKFRPLQSRQHMPGMRPIKPANDNGRRAGDHGVRAKRPRLVCRWSLVEGTSRLACRWEVESSNEPSGSLRAHRRLHKTFFELSYQPSWGKLALLIDRMPPVENAERAVGSLAVLHAGHARMPSTRGAALLPCCCEQLAITMAAT